MPASKASSSLAATVGASIKAARKRAGLRQRDLAVLLDIDQMAVSRWERGEHRPSDTNLLKLADKLNCTVADFYTEEEIAA